MIVHPKKVKNKNNTFENKISNNDSIDFQHDGNFLERPRLHSLLENAIKYPLIVICAGEGYGKTRTVCSFLHKYDAQITWIQFSERDNIPTRFWENYVNSITGSFPEAAARFLEIGFPEMDEALAKFKTMVREASALPKKQIVVYDDFHFVQNPTILRLIELTTNIAPSNSSIILLSRTMPKINLVDMMLNERIFTINEDMLCFTEDEIAEYFNQLDIMATEQNIRDIYENTRGWAFAVNLIGRSLSKANKYDQYALKAMKTNIFNLIEGEISHIVSEGLWRFLLRISLIDHLAASLIRELAHDDALIKEMEQLSSYIRYDLYMDAYVIHHLVLDYLRQNQNILTDEERRNTFQTAGLWCEQNNYLSDALAYYEKSGDYDAIMRIIYGFNMPVAEDMAKYTLEIFNRLPEEVKFRNPLFPVLNLKLKISLGLLDEASTLVKKYAEDYEAQPESPEKNRALSEIYAAWAIIRMAMCHYDCVYDFDIYFEKQCIYCDKNSTTAFGTPTKHWVISYPLLSKSCDDAPEEYIQALSRANQRVSPVLRDNIYGLDDLTHGELHYYRWELNDAEQSLRQALNKAHTNYGIQSRAMLFLMRIPLCRGDIQNAKAMLQSIKVLLDPIRYETYDIALSHYYLALDQPNQIPDWLKSDFLPYVNINFFENYASRIKVMYHYYTEQYGALLAFCENVRRSTGKTMFIVFEALSFYKLKRRKEAISALAEAYELAAPNKLITPFTQHTKDMRTLTAYALRDDRCQIPKPWLENINRKSSALSKKISHMVAVSGMGNDPDKEISLTKREKQVLGDLSHGLSRTEIAANQNISKNTVKMLINIIYNKLHANSMVDAIRIAIEHKII